METNADQLSELIQRYARGRTASSRAVPTDGAAALSLRQLPGRRHSPEAEVLTRDPVRVVTLELGRMSEKNRVAYVLLKEEGLSVKEAAAVLGTSAPVVRQCANRAYEQFRSALGAAGSKENDHDGSWDAAAVRA
jgi:DNA-directed RNA polymerase specialized sigma24 family protein